MEAALLPLEWGTWVFTWEWALAQDTMVCSYFSYIRESTNHSSKEAIVSIFVMIHGTDWRQSDFSSRA